MRSQPRGNTFAALAQDLGRKKKFRTPGEAAVLAILRSAALLRRALAAHFEAAGMTMAQYNVLRILRGAPEGLPTLQIRRRMLEEAAGITRLVDKLSADGLIERDRPASDRRKVLCRITRRGLELLQKHEGEIDEAHASLIGGLDTKEAGRLVELLLKVNQCVREKRKADSVPLEGK